jgi:hypothetical protein
MNLLSKEYRSIAGALIFALALISTSVAYLWTSLDLRNQNIGILTKRGKELQSLRTGNPPPTSDHLKQLEKQLEQAHQSFNDLHSVLCKLNIPLDKIPPQDFKASLNAKSKEFSARAEKGKVAIPLSFYMDFDLYTNKLPSEEAVPQVNRQLIASELILNSFLESKPIALKAFRIIRPESAALTSATSTAATTKADPKIAQKSEAPTILSSQSFEIQFSSSPESLRAFLNGITSENRAFFAVRQIKVVNSKEKEPPRKGEVLSPVSDSFTNLANAGQPKVENVAQYILGDEHVEVDVQIDLVSFLPVPVQSSETKTGGSKPKEGTK